MSICTSEITKALESQKGVPINFTVVSKSPEAVWTPDTSCPAPALSPYPELNEELPEHLDDLAIMYGRHFGE